MQSEDAQDTLFEKKYKEDLKNNYPCYAGACWAFEQIFSGDLSARKNPKDLQIKEDARLIFLDLYAFAVKELGSEAVQQFSKSIQHEEGRASFHGKRSSTNNIFRKKGFFCKKEIQFLEKTYKKLLK